MFIGNNYMVQIRNWKNKIQNPEYFIDEKTAIDYANDQWKTGAREVVLYKRDRVGYRELKRATNSENEARAKWTTYIEQLSQLVGATIERG